MAQNDGKRVTIVGAGLGGALLANYLAQAAWDVQVFERRPDPRRAGFIGGRSINLAISARGISGLKGVGLEEEIMQLAIPMRGRMIHSTSGELSYQPYDKDPSRCINSISRGGLNQALIEAAERHDNVQTTFAHPCTGIDLERPAVTFTPESGTPVEVESDLVIGADGAYSEIREALQHSGRFNYSQEYLDHGYKELCIPPTDDGDFRIEPNALHIWPRGGFMMIALPNPDKSFTCTLFTHHGRILPDGRVQGGHNSLAHLSSDEKVMEFFEREFRDAIPHMPTLLEDFRENPSSALVTIRCRPWHHLNKVALLGDASHAIVPFYGQGMNAAFEDCVALDATLKQLWPSEDALRIYSQRRKPHADAIADLALQNFIEMRDHTGSRKFRAWKHLERWLHGWFPGYLPLYTMVSFTTIPYADAVERDRKQWRRVQITAGVFGVLLVVLIVLLLRWLLGG